MRFLVILFLSGCCFIGQEEIDGYLRAGAASISITPPVGIPMGGYLHKDRRALGIHDDLYARCLILEPKSGKRLAIISIDLVGFLPYDLIQIRKEAEEENIFICSTHNHSGPDSLGIFGVGRDENYMSEVRQKIVELLKATAKNLEPVRLYFGKADSGEISINWKSTELDRDINFLTAVGKMGTIATLVNFACHPEALGKNNRLITADFPGYVVKEIEKRFGGVALYVNGALGGMVSIHPETFLAKEKGFERAEEVGDLIALRVKNKFSCQRLITFNDFAIKKAVVAIPLQNEFFQKAIATKLIPTFSETYANGIINTEVSVIRFADLVILMVPGEITPGLAKKIKQMLRRGGRAEIMIFGLANDEIGYILPTEDFDLPKYKQERAKSLGPETGRRIYTAFQALVEP
ncbi:MAG: hypothetical protein G01um10143_302 [Parcubacteria group bacterium Gr01-1014_3]|nr:MAG: hypothetical protein G01um10143_302 [Parcubacteria group bacterium Gr01-1014_3]